MKIRDLENKDSLISLTRGSYLEDPFKSMVSSNSKNSMVETSLKMQKTQKLKNLSILPFFFFLISGAISLSMLTTLVSKIDDFDTLYRGYKYRYLVMTPTYLSYPLTYLVLVLLSGFSLKFKILISATFGHIMLITALVSTLIIKHTLLSFVVVMSCYFMSFSIFTCFSGYILTLLTKYTKFGVAVFFLG